MFKKAILSLFICIIASGFLMTTKAENAKPGSNPPHKTTAEDNIPTLEEPLDTPVYDDANIPINVTNETTPRPETKEEKPIPKVIAPALQYLREDYPSAFLSKEDYSIKLNTTTRYKLRCSDEITAVAVGYSANLIIKENDEPDDEKMLYELAAPKDIIVKTKYETYTYMQIYTENSDKPIAVLLSINSKNEVPSLITFGSCTMHEDLF